MYQIFKAPIPLLAQLAIGLGVALFLPLITWYGYALTCMPLDPDRHFDSVTTIQQKIADTDDQAEKAYQKRELAIVQEHQAEQERRWRRGRYWLAFPIGLLALTFGVFGMVNPVAITDPQLLSPLQRAEEIERFQSSPGQRLVRRLFFWLPYPFDLCVLLFAPIHRFSPIALGLIFGGLLTVTMACLTG